MQLLFRHGANAKQVQHWLGHHSPAFTLAVYVHLLPEDAPDPTFFDQITIQTSASQTVALEEELPHPADIEAFYHDGP